MNVRLLAAAAAALLTIACGSDSKKAPAPSGRSVAYTGPTTAASLSATTDKAAIGGGVAQMATGFAGGFSGSLAFGAGVGERHATVRNALLIAADARHAQGDAIAAGVLTPATHACAGGGSMTITANDQDGNPATTSAGDYVEVAYAACDEGGGFVSDGSLRLTINQTPGDDFVANAASITTNRAFGLTLAFNNLYFLDTNTGTWDGSDGDIGVSFVATVSTGTIALTVSGTSLESAFGVGNTVSSATRISNYRDAAVETYSGMGTVNATLTQTSADLDARICSTEIAGCLNVVTDPAFVLVKPNLHPSSGAIQVSDDGGDFVKVTALSATSARLDWSIDGTTGSQTTTWDALDAAANQ